MRLDDYDILGELGRGGGHISYRARPRTGGGEVCLQMLPLGWLGYSLSPGHLDSFLAALDALAVLDHPNIVPVLAVGRYDSGGFLVRPLPPGQTLAQRVGHQPVEPRQAALWVLQLAEAVGHAHDHGVFGPGLDMHEIQITTSGEARLTTFDLAHVRFLQPPTPAEPTSAIIGVPAYFSPERLRGESRPDDPRQDVWALGVLLFRLLTGRLPFAGDTTILMFHAILEQEGPSLRELRSEVSADLETITQRCLKKRLQQRYPGMAELETDLRAFLDGRPITNQPQKQSMLGRMGRWMRGWWQSAGVAQAQS